MTEAGSKAERTPPAERALGPFALLEPIGRGASGEVWRGHHRVHEVPVAVKIVSAARSHDPATLEAFRNEVRSVAGLDHPNIIGVLDHGVVPPGLEDLAPPGSPFLVMELAAGGSLKPRCGRMPWEEIQGVLVDLLDALAHAHARGVIHRDLKPGNVLLGGLRPGVKLTDFGLAQLLEVSGGLADDVAGTPAYMAPEQFHGHARDFGPWTDLYALGCLAWALVCGAPPYGRESPLEARRGHLYRPLPSLEPAMAVPASLDAWLHRLLEKDPARRFQRAADAAWALLSLSGPLLAAVAGPGDEVSDAPTVIVSVSSSSHTITSHTGRSMELSSTSSQARPGLAESTLAGSFDAASLTWRGADAVGLLEETIEETPTPGDDSTTSELLLRQALDAVRPVVPPTWQRAAAAPGWQRLGAAGLQLFGLRAIPVVDREAERDRLWANLREVCRDEVPRGVLLVGPAGCGKSRLAEWFCERAHEVGAANVFKALHSPHAGPLHGLPAMLARALRCVGLAGDEAGRRVQAALAAQGVADPVEVATATALVVGEGEGAPDSQLPGAVRFTSPAERYAVLRRFLARSTLERPAVVWLDDVSWGLDAIRFAISVLDAPESERAPILLVLTAREEALPECPLEAEQLRAFLSLPNTERIGVGPLEPEHQRGLVRSLLDLDDILIEVVLERTAGNPLFAVQLIGDWVQRGLLVAGPEGFRLKPDASVELPPSLASMWQDRVDRVLRALEDPDSSRVALELAATLGQDVDAGEWEAVCRVSGVEAPWPLVEVLVTERLARASEGGMRGGWSFAHGMLRESLLAAARAGGRLEAHHRSCANALATLGDATPWVSLTERVGRHLLEGGDPEGALSPLLEAAKSRITGGDYRWAELLLRERERALDAAGLAEADRRRGEGLVPLAEALRNLGRLAEAEATARGLIEAASRHGWAELNRRGRFAVAHLTRIRGLYSEAMAEQERLEPEVRASGDAELLLRVLREKGRIRLDQGDLGPAMVAYQEAWRLSLGLNQPEIEGLCLRDLSNLHLRAGRHALSLQHMKAARARFARSGNRWGIADACNMLGEVDRELGRLDRAEARYRESISRFTAIGSFDVIIPNLNLATVLLWRGRLGEVPALLAECHASASRLQSRSLEAIALGLDLVYAATVRDWAAWATSWQALEALIAEADCVDLDLAASLELAGQRAAGGGASSLGLAALRLSATCWTALRRPADAERVHGQIRRIDDESTP